MRAGEPRLSPISGGLKTVTSQVKYYHGDDLMPAHSTGNASCPVPSTPAQLGG